MEKWQITPFHKWNRWLVPWPFKKLTHTLILLVVGIAIMSGRFFPPSLMDDVDAVNAQIARTMLESGDNDGPN
jgi:hypothetical protein